MGTFAIIDEAIGESAMLWQPSHRSETSWQSLRRSTDPLSYSILFWFNSSMSAAAECRYGEVTCAYLDAVDARALQEQRGGATIYEWLWGFDQPSPFVLALLLSIFSLLVGWALKELLLIHYRNNPNEEDYSRGIRWAAYTALIVPLAGFKDAGNLRIEVWLISAAFVITLWTALAFICGYASSSIKNKFGNSKADTREFYETALLELENGQLAKGLWAQCLAKSKGKESAARAYYLKARSADLAKLSKSQTRGANTARD